MANNNKATLGLSLLALFLVVAAVTVAVLVTQKEESSAEHHHAAAAAGNKNIGSSTKAVEHVCKPTFHREMCVKKLSAATNSTDTKELVEVAFNVTMKEISKVMKKSKTLQAAAKDPRTSEAFKICQELLQDSIDDIKRALDRMVDHAGAGANLDLYMNDIKVWLSGALTFENTCLEGFLGTEGDSADKMKKLLVTAQQLTGNTLEMVDEIHDALVSLDIAGLNRKLLADSRSLPVWATAAQRRLLEAPVTPDVVVAKDGSGKYKTINEAIPDIPLKSNKSFVIHIKAGVYKENVVLTKKMMNVVFVGDGPTKTIISGSRSYVGGYQTSETGTVIVKGSGFMGKNIGIENTAGPENHQAVALRVQSDQAIFHNCQIDAYQDTLYVHAHRQFYRDCTVTGTIDFIFGNAAAVFQSCKLIIRKPMINNGSGQSCMVTAQGRSQPDEPTGIAILNSVISATPEYLTAPSPIVSFLGRPWRQHARTVIINSKIDAPIAPEGWSPFQGTWGLEDCWYGEFGNTGKGADVSKRAKWAGVKGVITKAQADEFAPGKFILGDTWIPASGVPYSAK
ncbi:PREDICTED: pectinesterase-like [Ipomoea nil]|uniref:pectinesterase-like n=1 Tax=Ipomoea nil TaxID=35883 RepID=UPI00090102CE|nr:PREDICTED: pectinesterase-like [Ipomoea nil]XP_019180170.1 PREDICTED: pectinesterase-like [Ipomoea nil]